MIKKFAILWVLGLFTAVPYAVYYLLYYAPRDQYALLITFVLFWIFGYWGVAGPIISIVRIRRVFRALEIARSPEQLRDFLQSPDSQEAAIDYIAAENKIPKFIARKLFTLALEKLAAKDITLQRLIH